MKKILYIFTFLTMIIFTSCSLNNEKYNVEFILNNDTPNIIMHATDEGYVIYPNIPYKDNSIFKCWCIDEELKNEFDFSSKVTSNIKLYAKYEPDFKKITNIITTSIIKTCVSIKTIELTNDINNIATINGSGVIIKSDSDIYYVLTNNHVCYKTTNLISYEICDYSGNFYDAKLLYSSAEYDLAILSFQTKQNLDVIKFSDFNPIIGSNIIALGNPDEQKNSITYGEINSYSTIPTSNFDTTKTNVSFDTISHTAYINDGSSGGPLLDMNLNLIGLNFASGSNKKGEFISGHSIPILKIKEYLTTLNFII